MRCLATSTLGGRDGMEYILRKQDDKRILTICPRSTAYRQDAVHGGQRMVHVPSVTVIPAIANADANGGSRLIQPTEFLDALSGTGFGRIDVAFTVNGDVVEDVKLAGLAADASEAAQHLVAEAVHDADFAI